MRVRPFGKSARFARGLTLTALALGAAVFAAAKPAFAKNVSVEWKKIKGAARYEVQVDKDGKTVLRKMTEDTSWEGPLDFGVYDYEIRAYDRAKRPGAWSSPKALVVMPSPPELVSPDGDTITFYGREAKATLKWKPVPGAAKYMVDVTRAGSAESKDQSVFHQEVTGTEQELPRLGPGNYRWHVTAVVEATAREPATLNGRHWESKPSDTDKFELEREKLDSPDPIFPKGEMKPPPAGKLEFKWMRVRGAEAYELRVSEVSSEGRAPAGAHETVLTTHGTSIVAPVPGEGHYRWQVRALASIDANNVPEAVSPQSTADFELNRNSDFFEGSGYLAASTMIAPYSYRLQPYTGGNEQTSSEATDFRLSGEYWFKPQWGVAAGFDDAIFQIDNSVYTRLDEEVDLKYRVNLTSSKYAWVISPKIGVLRRGYPYIFATSNGFGGASQLQLFDVNTIGPVLGVDVRKQLSDKLSLGLKLAYYYPLVSDNGTTLVRGVDDANNRNWGFGAQALYWLNARWGAGAGFFVEDRSIAAEQGGQSDHGASLYMDGTYFFASLIYSFGR